MVGAADDVDDRRLPVRRPPNVNRIAGGELGIFAGRRRGTSDRTATRSEPMPSATGSRLPSAAGIFDRARGDRTGGRSPATRIRMAGGVGIEQRFTGSTITGTSIESGGEIGILTGVSGRRREPDRRQRVEGAELHGILIEDDGNEVLGNVDPRNRARAGIRIQTPFNEGILPSTGNLIGGDRRDENTISESGGAAIEISDLEDSDNEVAAQQRRRQRRPFIDLVGHPGDQPNGPNHGIHRRRSLRRRRPRSAARPCRGRRSWSSARRPPRLARSNRSSAKRQPTAAATGNSNTP